MLIDTNTGQAGSLSSDSISKRLSVRYVRKDLKAFLINYSFFSYTPLRVKLIDIGSRGAQVSTSKKLKINKKLSISIRFLDGYKFLIKGKIVRREEQVSYLYDISFGSISDYIDMQSATFSKIYMFIGDQRINAKYRNVMDNRVQILLEEKLNKKNDLTICFKFSNGDTIQKEAGIRNIRKITRNFYGIKFDSPNTLLGNYILKTQRTLTFG